jgi:hypothetical protein
LLLVSNAVIFTSPTVSAFEKNSLAIALVIACGGMCIVSCKSIAMLILERLLKNSKRFGKYFEEDGKATNVVDSVATSRLRQIGLELMKRPAEDWSHLNPLDVDAMAWDEFERFRQDAGDEFVLRWIQLVREGIAATQGPTSMSSHNLLQDASEYNRFTSTH